MFGNSKKEKKYQIEVEGIPIEISMKRIKNIYVRVHRTSGKVRISLPHNISRKNLMRFIDTKLSWIKHQIAKAERREPEPKLELVSGESVVCLGKKYKLEVREWRSKNVVRIDNDSLIMSVKKSPSKEIKEKILDEWYRSILKEEIPIIIEKYEEIMGVKVSEFGVKRMKTRWGTCNITHKRIWLSLHLAKKPYKCLEMVVVHEMVHLLERLHNNRFYRFMDEFMPHWRDAKSQLDSNID